MPGITNLTRAYRRAAAAPAVIEETGLRITGGSGPPAAPVIRRESAAIAAYPAAASRRRRRRLAAAARDLMPLRLIDLTHDYDAESARFAAAAELRQRSRQLPDAFQRATKTSLSVSSPSLRWIPLLC